VGGEERWKRGLRGWWLGTAQFGAEALRVRFGVLEILQYFFWDIPGFILLFWFSRLLFPNGVG
jgi:hypothetical protein